VCQQQKVASYTGVDITAISIQNLTLRYPEFRFTQADVSDGLFALRDHFDIVLAADVLFHIVDDDRFQKAITNLSQCLRPGGYIILSDVLPACTVQTTSHCRWRSLAEYRSILIEHRLAIQHVEPIFAMLQPPVQVPGNSLLWEIYALIWSYGLLRVAQQSWFDCFVPRLLGCLDERFFLARSGVSTPNSKWLVAVKTNVA
jgi:SAM-dependent methyltransferase